ncbi:putative DNA-binding protein [Marinomonas sp. MED121]|nr:putative DNA-binding protein [Marinomonas sp. MED121]
MQAPKRFPDAVKQAILANLATLPNWRIHPRFHLFESISLPELNKCLLGCEASGSNGVLLKAPDESLIKQGVDHLFEMNIPVVTLVTDLPYSKRLAYIGIDNRAAGRTAAYMLNRLLNSNKRAWQWY